MCACIHLSSCVQCILNGTTVHHVCSVFVYICTQSTYFVHVVHGCVLTLFVVHMLTLAGSVHELHVPGSP